jgi:hypothetical protein
MLTGWLTQARWSVLGPCRNGRVWASAVTSCAPPALDAAVAGAAKRSLGDSWAWARRGLSVDISPLVAVSLARWGHATRAHLHNREPSIYLGARHDPRGEGAAPRGRSPDQAGRAVQPGLRGADGLPRRVLGGHPDHRPTKERQPRGRRYGPTISPAQPRPSTRRNAQEWRATETVLCHRGMAQPYGPHGRRSCGLRFGCRTVGKRGQLGRSGTFRSTTHTYQSPIPRSAKLH